MNYKARTGVTANVSFEKVFVFKTLLAMGALEDQPIVDFLLVLHGIDVLSKRVST